MEQTIDQIKRICEKFKWETDNYVSDLTISKPISRCIMLDPQHPMQHRDNDQSIVLFAQYAMCEAPNHGIGIVVETDRKQSEVVVYPTGAHASAPVIIKKNTPVDVAKAIVKALDKVFEERGAFDGESKSFFGD